MNHDYETRLSTLAEKLADVFLEDGDPEQWAGRASPPRERTKAERGDRQWDLKNANQVGLLFARALELRVRLRWVRQTDAGENPPPLPGEALSPPADPEEEMKRFEEVATAALERAAGRRRGS